jgi:metal-responsive CopG/Arc/MetJ family transcriptional regulator
MDVQDITLTLPKELVQKIQALAARRNLSVSELVAHLFKELIVREADYQQAKARHVALQRLGFNLGTFGQTRWTRDEPHER